MFNFDEIWGHLKKPGVVGKFEAVGDVLQYLIPWSAIVAIALVGNVAAAWMWVYGSLAVVILTQAGKFAFNNTKLGERPNGGEHSFPRGHTSGAFSGAAFWFFLFGWQWGLVPVALAVATGMSRVAANKHWTHDVIAGAALATGVVWAVTTFGIPSFLPTF